MGSLKTIPCFCLLLSLLATPLKGLEILDPEEVEYIHLQARGVLGGCVALDCGPTQPTIFIWGFARSDTDANQALAYNYGQGPKIQPLAASLGVMRVPTNTSVLLIEQLPWAAEGTYTCQALYDTDDGPKITFYYTHLDIVEEGELEDGTCQLMMEKEEKYRLSIEEEEEMEQEALVPQLYMEEEEETGQEALVSKLDMEEEEEETEQEALVSQLDMEEKKTEQEALVSQLNMEEEEGTEQEGTEQEALVSQLDMEEEEDQKLGATQQDIEEEETEQEVLVSRLVIEEGEETDKEVLVSQLDMEEKEKDQKLGASQLDIEE